MSSANFLLAFAAFAAASVSVSLAALPSQIRIAAIFDDTQDPKHELAFKYGVERVNRDPSILPGKRLQPEIIRVPADNRSVMLSVLVNCASNFPSFPSYSMSAERETCALLKRGVAAIFGPQSQASADHIMSIIDSVEIPFIDTRWNYRPSARVLGTKSHKYTINLHPDVETLGEID